MPLFCLFLLSFDWCAMYFFYLFFFFLFLILLKFSTVEIPFILLSMLKIELNCCFYYCWCLVLRSTCCRCRCCYCLCIYICVCDYSSPPPLVCSVTYCFRLKFLPALTYNEDITRTTNKIVLLFEIFLWAVWAPFNKCPIFKKVFLYTDWVYLEFCYNRTLFLSYLVHFAPTDSTNYSCIQNDWFICIWTCICIVSNTNISLSLCMCVWSRFIKKLCTFILCIGFFFGQKPSSWNFNLLYFYSINLLVIFTLNEWTWTWT